MSRQARDVVMWNVVMNPFVAIVVVQQTVLVFVLTRLTAMEYALNTMRTAMKCVLEYALNTMMNSEMDAT